MKYREAVRKVNSQPVSRKVQQATRHYMSQLPASVHYGRVSSSQSMTTSKHAVSLKIAMFPGEDPAIVAITPDEVHERVGKRVESRKHKGSPSPSHFVELHISGWAMSEGAV